MRVDAKVRAERLKVHVNGPLGLHKTARGKFNFTRGACETAYRQLCSCPLPYGAAESVRCAAGKPIETVGNVEVALGVDACDGAASGANIGNRPHAARCRNPPRSSNAGKSYRGRMSD